MTTLEPLGTVYHYAPIDLSPVTAHDDWATAEDDEERAELVRALTSIHSIDVSEAIAEALYRGLEVAAYEVSWAADETATDYEHADAVEIDGRFGIAWGAGADWADAPDIATAVRWYVTDPETYAEHN